MALNPFSHHIGLDISDYRIRFFELHRRGDTVKRITAFGELVTPPGCIHEGVIAHETELVNLIKKLIEKPEFGHRVEGKYVNAALPEKRIFTKVIEIPLVPPNELRGAISWGIEQNIPVALEAVNFDWSVLQKNEKTQKLLVLVSVAPKPIVDSYTNVIKMAGLIPISLENESLAITRSLIAAHTNTSASSLIIDLGRSRTNLIISKYGGMVYTATIEINGTAMTTAVAETLKLSFEDAEKAKIICGLDKRKAKGVIARILDPMMDILSRKISEHLEYYNNYFPNSEAIGTVLLTGSVSQMVGLPAFLGQALKATVKIADPLINLSGMKQLPEKSKVDLLPFTTAIGLSLKKFD